jgi:hypothetical protein
MDQLTASSFLALYQLAAERASGIKAVTTSHGIEAQLEASLNDTTLSTFERDIRRKQVAAMREGVDAVRSVADFFIAHLPPELAAPLRAVPVGTLPRMVVNAETMLAPDGTAIVVVASGLWSLLFETGGWCAAATPFVVEVGAETAPAEATIDTAAVNILRWVMFHHSGDLGSWDPATFQSRYEVRRNMIGGLWQNAFNFVLGHEYAHGELGHLDNPRLTTRRLAPDVDGGPEAVDFTAEMELAADVRAAELAFAFAETSHPEWLTITMAGVELALQMLALRETLFSPPTAAGSHPPSAQRLDVVHAAITARYGAGLVDTVGGLAEIFERTAALGRPAVAAERFVEAHRLGELGRADEEIAAYEDLAARLADTADPVLREFAARAVVAIAARRAARHETDAAASAYDEVVDRFGDVRSVAANALMAKAELLGTAERWEAEIAAYQAVASRFAGAPEVNLRAAAATARMRQAERLRELGRIDELVAVCNALVRDCSRDPEGDIQALGTGGVLMLGIVFGERGDVAGELEAYGELVARFGDSPHPAICRAAGIARARREAIAEELVAKATALVQHGGAADAWALYGELIAGLCDGPEPRVRELARSLRFDRQGEPP